ncbi:lysophospholipid acyltransferase family protein [Hydrogenophaga sp. OTU3427]|uniref:lysophospholipid acyltransferase family protein n=1 Tax=Hydrogenophaga sp. OTU3427 TaxID=3043856 RepID=UPI00313A8EE9
MLSRTAILFMRLLAPLPLSWVRALGWLLGRALHAVAGRRRKIALTNLRLCFPELSEPEREAMVRRNFVYFMQAWLDRSWLWHAPRSVLESRFRRVGDWQVFQGQAPTIVFAPHFYGLDAGAMALAMAADRRFTTIYTTQVNRAVDEWMKVGRSRFGDVSLLNRDDGVKPIVSSLRKGGLLYLLPDMNFGPEESIFVPFFGVPTATVPSLSRFARLGRAQVVPLTTRLTPTGYEVEAHPVWQGFPTEDVVADTALMNERLQAWIAHMPDQYWWVHKRFKTRPPGEASVYGGRD